MKFSISREDLLSPLQQVIGAIEKRQTMPSLSNVLVRTNDNTLSLTATDLEIELVSRVQLMVDQPGEITIPAKKFLDICKALPA
ncbi:MAG: polymerase subunit beta, partial [Pseudomonadota bacterium]|nr:polymerase subunit beta [Pseudomonadota bacterium]